LGKFIPKITNFGDFGALSPHFKATTSKFRERVRSWDSLPTTKFCKNRVPFGENLYQKLPIFAISGVRFSKVPKSDLGLRFS